MQITLLIRKLNCLNKLLFVIGLLCFKLNSQSRRLCQLISCWLHIWSWRELNARKSVSLYIYIRAYEKNIPIYMPVVCKAKVCFASDREQSKYSFSFWIEVMVEIHFMVWKNSSQRWWCFSFYIFYFIFLFPPARFASFQPTNQLASFCWLVTQT